MDSITSKWCRTRADEIAVKNGCYFSLEAAEHARDFFSGYLFVKPHERFKLYDWQYEKIIAPIFGWKRPDKTRRFRVAYCEVAKKNGKSIMAAGIQLYLCIADNEYAAEVYNVAFTVKQADNVYIEALKLIRNSPELKDICKVKESDRSVFFEPTMSFIKVLTGKAASSEGKNIHGLVYDELHVARSRDLWDALRYGGRARKQPLIFGITTAGWDRQSICWELHQQALNVSSGITPQDDFYGMIFAAGEKDDWKLESTWQKANPSYGLCINAKDFESECKEAQQTAAKENNFRRYSLCQWVDQETRFISLDKWQACAEQYTAEDLLGKTCMCGIDLSSNTALTAVTLAFPFDDGTYKLLHRFYVPEQTINNMRGRLSYDVWKRQRFITEIPGNVIDYDIVLNDIKALGRQYHIPDIGIDPANAQNLETQLQNSGFKVTKVYQYMSTMGPLTKDFERLILNGKIRHNSNPVMDWMMSCLTVKSDSEGNFKPSKPDRMTSVNQIDGVISTILALGMNLYKQNSAAKTKSVYETRGVLVF